MRKKIYRREKSDDHTVSPQKRWQTMSNVDIVETMWRQCGDNVEGRKLLFGLWSWTNYTIQREAVMHR